jgi:hypothetical protein
MLPLAQAAKFDGERLVEEAFLLPRTWSVQVALLYS